MTEDKNELLYLVDLERLHEDIEVRLNGFHGKVLYFGELDKIESLNGFQGEAINIDEYDKSKTYDFNAPEPKVEEIRTVNGDNKKLNGMPLTVKGHVPLVNNKTGRNCGKISVKLDISYDLDEEIVKS